MAFFSRAEERVELLETATDTQPTGDSHSEDYDETREDTDVDYDETPPRARHLWWEDTQGEAEGSDVDEADDPECIGSLSPVI